MYESFLRMVPLFADLADEDLTRLCELVGEVRLAPRELLFGEGDPADRAYVLYEGELEIVHAVDGRESILDVKGEPGTMIGEIALFEATTRRATVRARRESCLLTLEPEQLLDLIRRSPQAARIMLSTLAHRWEGMEASLRHNERLAQLGRLTAGIAHELNNPIAAVTGSARQLRASVAESEAARVALDKVAGDAAQQAEVLALARRIEAMAAHPPPLTALDRSDREEGVQAWLESRRIGAAWTLAPVLVTLHLTVEELERLAARFPPAALPALLRWVGASATTYALVGEIAMGAGRISEIVRALKSYVYLDQAPVQDVDIHEGLENTLLILRNRLGEIHLHREFSPTLPRIEGYGSELNQLWTNLIDNAAAALEGRGDLTLRTRRDGEDVIVEIEDSGPGIPPDVQRKIFEPFFTTKPPGKGTGLGLNISHNIVQKHGGAIEVESRPGRTLFEVRLPIKGPQGHG